MALPANGAVWPPEPHVPAYRDFAEYDAWYTGDIDKLTQTYSYQMASGVWGQIKRWFWGSPRPNQQGERPIKMHVPVASELARMSAQTVWGEMPAVAFADLDEDGDPPKGTQKQIDAMNARLTELIDDSLHAALIEAAELGAALTGSYLRICWDTTISDTPFLVPMAPDQAIPTFRQGRLVEVIFWQELPKLDNDPTVWLMLEDHRPGVIEYGLYAATKGGGVGTRVPLTEHPAMAGLATQVGPDGTVATGSELLTAVYFPNVKPNRARRKDPVMGAMGRSDFDGCLDLMDALDETYTSWMRDIRLGKARVLIDRQYLTSNGPGQGAQFNADAEVFTQLEAGLGGLNSGTGGPIEQVQFAIRVQEHQATAVHLLTRIFAAAGYSPSTFGEADNDHAPRTVTATEVDSREKLTLMTREAKIRYAKPALRQLMAALLDVDKHVFGGPGRFDGDFPEVEFPDAMAPSMDALAQTAQLLRAAEAASTETLVEMVHPDWNAELVKAEVARISDEKASAFPALPDPTGMSGADLAAGPDDPAAPAGAAKQQPAAGDGAGSGGGDGGRGGGAAGAPRS